MSKKTNDKTVDLLYMNKNLNKGKSANKGKKTKNKNIPKKIGEQNEAINLDNEIIIGLTPKPVQKVSQKNTTTNKTKMVKNIQKASNKTKKANKNNAVRNKRRLKILKWTSIIILFIGVIILFMLSPIFNIKQITVEGIDRLTAEEVISLSQIKIDENTFKIRGVNVIERIKSNSYVEAVDIERVLPDEIKITIKERVPQYIIEIANGNVYIDSKGYILEISTEKLQLPILEGYQTSVEDIINFENTKKLSDEDCEKLEVINQVYDAAENNSILSYITSIDMTDIEDIKLNLETENKIAYLGDASNANIRILYLKEMIEKEAGIEGEAFINGDIINQKPKPYFREKV